MTRNGDNIYSLAAHQGVTKTELSRNMSKQSYDDAVKMFGELMNAEQGALPSLYASVADDIEKAGFYGTDQHVELRGYPIKTAILPNALDKKVAEKLWNVAEEITNITFPG